LPVGRRCCAAEAWPGKNHPFFMATTAAQQRPPYQPKAKARFWLFPNNFNVHGWVPSENQFCRHLAGSTVWRNARRAMTKPE